MSQRAMYVWVWLIGCLVATAIAGLIVLGVSIENGHAADADIAASAAQQARYSACAALSTDAVRNACVNPPAPSQPSADNTDPTGKVRACINSNSDFNGEYNAVICIRGVIGDH